MKRIMTTAGLALLFCLPAAAQTKKVDIDNEWFTYAYRELPKQAREPAFFYYAAEVNATSTARKNLSVQEIKDAIWIEGQRKTDSKEEALLILGVSLGDILVVSSDVAERKQEVKDKEGKVTATNYFYTVKVTYTFEAAFSIRAGETKLANTLAYNRNTKLSYASSEYTKRKDAVDFWNNNREVLISGFYRELSLGVAAKVSELASYNYGFRAIKGARDLVKITDEKKHAENEAFRSAVKTLTGALKATTPDEPLDRALVTPLINYFKSIPKKYTDTKLKADISLRYAAYFNLCKIYLLLDEPDKVGAYADRLVANGLSPKDGEKLKKEAEELKAALEKAGVNTRHFKPDEYF
ncbi:MAG: hypothetical protein LBQ65_08415 [Tannerellaceae bacterium]|jgi:hypothetical protein|nr:hypothetical protein [Tannerellaceae bacterium]